MGFKSSNKLKETDIGLIPELWDVVPLSKIADFQNGYAFSSNAYVPAGEETVPVFKMGNIKIGGGIKISGNEDHVPKTLADSTRNYFVHKDDILMCMTDMKGNVRLLGYSARIKDEVFLQNQRVGRIRPKQINPGFLYYYLNSGVYIDFIRSTARSGVQVNLTTEAIKDSPVLIPNTKEQKQIAEILSSLDDKIELNHKMNANLEKMASALFKKWFVDIGDDLLEGWRMGKLGEEFEIIMGQSPAGDTYNESGEGLPFYQGRTDFGFRFPARRIYCTDPQRKAMASDTLISVRAPVGDINMATEDCCIGRGVGAVRKDGFPSYTFYMIKALQSEIAEFDSEGTIFGSINKNSLANISCIVPSKKWIVEFERTTNKIDAQILNLSKEIENLASIRDSLLPRLMSGKLRVLYGK